jgi:hypothetical protein
MKRAEVAIGETYKTKVGNHLADVLVLGETTSPETAWSKPRHFFTVRNVQTGRELRRTAAALRALPVRVSPKAETLPPCGPGMDEVDQ